MAKNRDSMDKNRHPDPDANTAEDALEAEVLEQAEEIAREAEREAAEAREEAEAIEPVGEDGPHDEPDLASLLEDARAKADEHYEQLLRSRAEFDNLRRRQERELENAHKFALENFAKELLQVRDSLELGLQAVRGENAELEKLREGTELTLKLLADAMRKFNIEQIDPQGRPFDPQYHQAMSIQPRDDVPPNTVVQVVQKGYTLNDRLIRPAMVMVSQAAS